MFDTNLQKFAQRVSFIGGWEMAGKIASQEAYQQIRQVWQDLSTSKENLLDSDLPASEDGLD